MDELDSVVARLAEIVDELLELGPENYGARFSLEKERDQLRAHAEQFHRRKDEGRSTQKLVAELAARESQLDAMRAQLVNRATQASSSQGQGASGDAPLSTAHGGTSTHAAMSGMGAGAVLARISEIEQELARRSVGESEDT